MKLYSYKLTLIDPLYFALEGISGAFTPNCIHATAINCAVSWSLGIISDKQSYITYDDKNEKRNVPKYENSLINENFYFTPAESIKTSYYPEIIKGDGDKYIQVGYGNTNNSKNKYKDSGDKAHENALQYKLLSKNEVLKSYQIYSIAPESQFEGYVYVKDEFTKQLPTIIRLGSFRSTVNVEYQQYEKFSYKTNIISSCSHLVDPLLVDVISGQIISMMPYPVIKNAIVYGDFLYVNDKKIIALIPNFEQIKIEPIILKNNNNTGNLFI